MFYYLAVASTTPTSCHMHEPNTPPFLFMTCCGVKPFGTHASCKMTCKPTTRPRTLLKMFPYPQRYLHDKCNQGYVKAWTAGDDNDMCAGHFGQLIRYGAAHFYW